jgi:hypothetical protein
MKSLRLLAMIGVVVAWSVSSASAGMQAEKMLRDVTVNHDLQKIKRNILSDVRSQFLSAKDTRQQARNFEPAK